MASQAMEINEVRPTHNEKMEIPIINEYHPRVNGREKMKDLRQPMKWFKINRSLRAVFSMQAIEGENVYPPLFTLEKHSPKVVQLSIFQ